MELHDVVYDACRAYITDMHHALPSDLLNKVSGMLRARQLLLLSSVSTFFDPAQHGSETLMVLLQIEAFFKKNALFADDAACLAAAQASFDSSEETCKATNERLTLAYSRGQLPDEVFRMQRSIEKCLGDFRGFLDELPRHWKVGSGASLTLPRRESYPQVRLHTRPWCSPGARKYLKAVSKYIGVRLEPRCTTFNRVEFVPKNWKTFRTIACEPEGNSFLQACFDSYIRQPLKRHFRVTLEDQSRNQRLALESSVTGEFATVDLKAASDTVALDLVHLLFPAEWAKFLCDIRSATANLDGRIIRYEKFASMGNGSTFPVETLIFAAACKAVGSNSFVVYGDDIIIETERVESLMALLAFLGFSVNKEKTHTTGSYRESCGLHAYAGRVITPLYIRDLDRRKPNLSLFINNLIRMVPFEGKTWRLAKELSQAFSLRASPQLGDMLAGVHVHVHHAYQRKLIHTRDSIPMTLAYSAAQKVLKYWDSRACMLWHLEKSRTPERVVESSRYTLGTHVYVSKWVGYTVTTTGPDHMYMWSDFFFA